ncbi:MAG: septum site-determining protein MinC [Burkholderiales bacterium]|nr:septum site-determining protein MinC [Burkholderiales bacterium]
MQKSSLHQPVEIKISTVVAISVILREIDLAVLDAALVEMTGGAPDFFDDEFAVIDLSHLGEEQGNIAWAELVALLKSYHLNAVAVKNSLPLTHDAIRKQGLSLDSSAKPHLETAPETTNAPIVVEKIIERIVEKVVQVPSSTSAPADTIIIDTPVRAGQRIYARGADLIITAVVNNGAEIIADGSIHVYAAMRGRALAGANGNANARIFAFGLEPELLSIAGMYRTFEEGVPNNVSNQPSMTKLIGERIDIQPIAPVGK